ncbi:helix-turn-helix domain-containing protein [Chamaesiphon polymorphus]|uniref:Transcriptional regulator n=1 Tax=Chamaesiphon polymorphus CCALA 037 TaxID=2107692 RepID=A0A2T1FJ39_9CYAN|nr:XRE family transcriptional regulator [Chamaesiphon polymorphus]PSB44949.1 transcriptional regulator [Chamaesiphon polymorphus CCALA 037]
MSQPHRTYAQIKQEFSPQMQAEISIGAQKIREELKILASMRQAADLTQEELLDLLDVRQSDLSQVEGRERLTISTLFGLITAMGGSIDITVNFPEKPPVQLSRIETLFLSEQNESSSSLTK